MERQRLRTVKKEAVVEAIEKEFKIAAGAQTAGNEGMVRVCARRAAGTAIGYWLAIHREKNWGVDAMNRLKNLQRDGSMPPQVQEAARRLTTKITEQFRSPFPTDPIADSRIIIEFFLKE